jgi:hypothetical protein
VTTQRRGALDAALLLDRRPRTGPALVVGRLRRAVAAGRGAHVLRLNPTGRRIVQGGRRAFVLTIAVRDGQRVTRTDDARVTLR